MSNDELLATFTIALCVILAVCFVVGRLVRWFGQPQVVGEMIAGVCLGPSLLGALAPGVQEHLFPQGPPMNILFTLSQVGLVMFMFLVGLEFDAGLLRQRARQAVGVSLAGILAPLGLGAGLAWLLLADHGLFFTPEVTPPQAMLFTGAAIATTAFPMLARIIAERGIARTSLGTLALSAGATDDAIAWCILALVVAVFGSNPVLVVTAVVGGLLYAVGMLTVGRRLLQRLVRPGRTIADSTLVVVLLLIMAGAWFTNTVGIHSIFGGFILGVAMPRQGAFADQLRERLEPLIRTFLLPLFFVYSGLNTQIGLVNTPALWAVAGLVLVVAILGKGVACWAAARANGVSNRESLAIGSLMNARGLMELILLNVGLQAGVITATMFTIFVLMAIVTTLMATPLFELFYGRHLRARSVPEPAAEPVAEPVPELVATAGRGSAAKVEVA
jgi:Kef-type K+ transport system membrane component KefB